MRTADAYVIIVAWRFGTGAQRVATRRTLNHRDRTCRSAGLRQAGASLPARPRGPWPPNRLDAMGGVPGAGQDVSRLRALLGTDYLAGIFPNARRPGHPGRGGVGPGADPPHGRPSARRDSVASPDMDTFAQGTEVSVSTLASINQMIQCSSAARALVLQIDEGQRWWSTRPGRYFYRNKVPILQ